MKTRNETKNRHAEREIATNECRREYDNLLNDDMLDEIALVECLCEEDE